MEVRSLKSGVWSEFLKFTPDSRLQTSNSRLFCGYLLPNASTFCKYFYKYNHDRQ
jgi:hypothetical protein